MSGAAIDGTMERAIPRLTGKVGNFGPIQKPHLCKRWGLWRCYGRGPRGWADVAYMRTPQGAYDVWLLSTI